MVCSGGTDFESGELRHTRALGSAVAHIDCMLVVELHAVGSCCSFEVVVQLFVAQSPRNHRDWLVGMLV